MMIIMEKLKLIWNRNLSIKKHKRSKKGEFQMSSNNNQKMKKMRKTNWNKSWKIIPNPMKSVNKILTIHKMKMKLKMRILAMRSLWIIPIITIKTNMKLTKMKIKLGTTKTLIHRMINDMISTKINNIAILFDGRIGS
jgi:hypothetical protein